MTDPSRVVFGISPFVLFSVFRGRVQALLASSLFSGTCVEQVASCYRGVAMVKMTRTYQLKISPDGEAFNV